MDSVQLSLLPLKLILAVEFYGAAFFSIALLKDVMHFFSAKPVNAAFVESHKLEDYDRNHSIMMCYTWL